ncbi:MAG: hypothetical protein M3O71_08870 [Bacteroidota bacterium]|nr:hypothetical protein [Bacteroidota bacterium]
MEQKSNKTIVLECYRKIIRDLDLGLVDCYVSDNYIQHSPTVKDGKEGLLEMLAFLKKLPKPPESHPSPIIRVIADGDLVATHLDVKLMGKRYAVVDLMRLEFGKLKEHWDVGQVQPERQDGPITMTNGISTIEDSADRNESKKLIMDFYDEILKPGNLEEAGKYLTPGFVEHNQESGLLSGLGENTKVHRIIGEGNFVLTHCESVFQDSLFAQFHIFKLEEDKIAEHWSVRQEVPEVMAHGNGMF